MPEVLTTERPASSVPAGVARGGVVGLLAILLSGYVTAATGNPMAGDAAGTALAGVLIGVGKAARNKGGWMGTVFGTIF